MLTLAALMIVKMAGDAALVVPQRALALSPDLRRLTVGRFMAGFVGGVVVPLVLAGVAGSTVALVGIVLGELLERSLFFTTASPPR